MNSFDKSLVTFENLMAKKILSLPYEAFEKQTVTLTKSNTADSLPMVCYSWIPKGHLSLTVEQAAAAKAAGILVNEYVDNSSEKAKAKGPRYSCRVALADKDGEPLMAHETLCNFRRYGWSHASGLNAKYGYCHGVIYANRCDGGLLCTNERDVIRDSLVRTLAAMPDACGIPTELVYSHASREALNWLFQDALQHVSEHASTPLRQGDPAESRKWDEDRGRKLVVND